MSTTGDAIELLKNIKDTTYNYQSQKHLAHAIHDAKRRLYTFVQSRHMTTQAYYEQFNNLIDVVNHIGGTYAMEPGLLEQLAATKGKAVSNLDITEKAEAKEQYIAVAFLLGTDKNRFGQLVNKLQNDFLQGYDGYPKTLSAAYQLIINWKDNSQRTSGLVNDGVSFTTVNNKSTDAALVNTDRRMKPNKHKVTCHRCGQIGHYANECTRYDIDNTNTTDTLDVSNQDLSTPKE